MDMADSPISKPITINNVEFKNRILRSSVGGRTANYDGTVTDVWKNFEKRFADGGIGGIISTTFHVNEYRVSPLQYPSIARQRYVSYLKKYIAEIKGKEPTCKYILQIGDPGYTTYTHLLPDAHDAKSASSGFDLSFGYNNTRTKMTEDEIEREINNFVNAAGRVRECGADGLEITASKGYIIHQFLNPGFNRRDDGWGGTADRRFRFLERIVGKVRERIGPDFLFGVRLSDADYNYSPLQFSLGRFPSMFLSRDRWMGNDVQQMIDYAHRLRKLNVDYLHIVSGFGFPNPRNTPGNFPFDEIKIFFNSTRHLSFKAAARSTLVNLLPTPLARWISNLGWVHPDAIRENGVKTTLNLSSARRFRKEVGLPVIVNGGFQERDLIERALEPAGEEPPCDMVSIARALLANPDLLRYFQAGKNEPDKRCSFCNRCVGRTATSPLGCYDADRFDSPREMLNEIMRWNRPD
jgi:2,4-dienoyl-CoA reductase-like NADH-dependent reductase (Old Yellow Enzyme family)